MYFCSQNLLNQYQLNLFIMKRLITLAAIILFSTFSFAQNYSFNMYFTGKLSNNYYVQLHHVDITNVTKDWSVTINYPDTLLTILYNPTTGINENAVENNIVAFPNPFNGNTTINIVSQENTPVSMQIFDITGKRYAQFNGNLSAGNNAFEINLSTPQVYFLSINGGNTTKLINSGNGNGNSIIRSTENSYNVSTKMVTNNPFTPGDEFRFVGYYELDGEMIASAPIENAPAVNEGFVYYTLVFEAITHTVTFDANGGTGVMVPQTFTQGISQLLNINSYTREGYFFSGWNTLANGEGTFYNNQQNVSISEDMTLYAQWLENAEEGNASCPVGYIRNNEDGENGEITAVRDHQNNSYGVVQIGTQCWMRENMRCTSTKGGTNLVVSSAVSTTIPYAYNSNSYNWGLLYNQLAAKDICPTGWHLPTVSEFSTMIMAAQANNEAIRLAGGEDWNVDTTNYNAPGYRENPNRNITNFTAVPAGFYSYLAFLGGYNLYAYFWTADDWANDNTYAHYLELSYNSNSIQRSYITKSCGLSIRCVRD